MKTYVAAIYPAASHTEVAFCREWADSGLSSKELVEDVPIPQGPSILAKLKGIRYS